MATIRDDLLPRCTVRVDFRNQPSGTGFFVAPGRVLTCAHVIQPDGPQAEAMPADLTIVDHDGKVKPVEQVTDVWSGEDPDLAILKVAAGSAQPCVLLDSQIGAGTEMHSYGYPLDVDSGRLLDERGSPTTFESEGTQGGNGWVKFKEGQVLPGMSGSPILNLTTGAVCAIVKRTRDRTQAIGGFGVPVSSLLKHASWLASHNEAAHAANQEWLDLLTVEQRQAWRVSQRPTVVTTAAIQLIVTVSQDEDRQWFVSAAIEPEGVTIGPLEVDLNTVRPAVARLFRAWAALGRITEGEQIQTLGEVLFRAVFPDEIDQALKRLLASGDDRVVVNLRFEDNVDADLVNLPWEHLYQPDQRTESGMSLAADSRLGFLRTLGDAPPPAPSEPTREQFSVLLVAVSPDAVEDDPAVSRALRDFQQLAMALPAVDVDVIDTPPPQELMEQLHTGEYDVVHYVGYGRYDGEDVLALGGRRQRGPLEYVRVETLRRCLRAGSPCLVVLQPCSYAGDGRVEAHAGPPAVPADFAMLGSPLLRLPLPAAVIFQYPLPPEVTARFNDAFYSGLADGKPIDMAVQEGRVQLSFASDQPRAYASPALFQREPGELRLVRGAPPSTRNIGRARKLRPALPALG